MGRVDQWWASVVFGDEEVLSDKLHFEPILAPPVVVMLLLRLLLPLLRRQLPLGPPSAEVLLLLPAERTALVAHEPLHDAEAVELVRAVHAVEFVADGDGLEADGAVVLLLVEQGPHLFLAAHAVPVPVLLDALVPAGHAPLLAAELVLHDLPLPLAPEAAHHPQVAPPLVYHHPRLPLPPHRLVPRHVVLVDAAHPHADGAGVGVPVAEVGGGGVDLRTDAFLHLGGFVGGVADAAEQGRAGLAALVGAVAGAAAGGWAVGVPEDVVLSHLGTHLQTPTYTICLKKRECGFAVFSTLSPPQPLAGKILQFADETRGGCGIFGKVEGVVVVMGVVVVGWGSFDIIIFG